MEWIGLFAAALKTFNSGIEHDPSARTIAQVFVSVPM
jgi:hypothetical protein